METSSKKRKIALFTQFFYPDKTGTGKILGELFSSLNSGKFKIEVVSSRQEYGAKGMTLLPRYENCEGVIIYRSGNRYFSKENSIGRILNYVLVFCHAGITSFKNHICKDKDIIVSVSNPPIMPLLTLLLKRKRQKCIYILHDLYPDIAIAMNVVSDRHIFSVVMKKINQIIFRKIDNIVVLGDDMKLYLEEKYDVSTDKIIVIPNWASKDYFKEWKSTSGAFKIVYSGNMGRFHSLDIAVSAVAKNKGIQLHFIGEGQAKAGLQAISEPYSNILFDTFLTDREYQCILQEADALFVSLEQNLSGLAVPSKFYTYLSAGRPILCVADESTEMAKLIRKYNCGIVIPHGNKKMFLASILRLKADPDLCEQMGNNAHNLYCLKYKKETIVKEYERLFQGQKETI